MAMKLDLTLREQRRRRVFGNRAHRKNISGPTREEVRGRSCTVRTSMICNVQKSFLTVIKSRKMKGMGLVATFCEKRPAYRVLMAKPEEKRGLCKSRHKG
jgi:hypothetical protein